MVEEIGYLRIDDIFCRCYNDTVERTLMTDGSVEHHTE